MALTNAQVKEILSAAGTPADAIDAAVKKIMDGHVTSINALREERDNYKTDAEKYPAVQKELDALKAKDNPEWHQKYEQEHEAFETFKKQIETEKEQAQKVSLYRDLLKAENVEEKRIDSIIRVTDFSGMTVTDGKLDKADDLRAAIKTDWAGFILSKRSKGAQVDNPPVPSEPSNFDKLSLVEKMDYVNEHGIDAQAKAWFDKKE